MLAASLGDPHTAHFPGREVLPRVIPVAQPAVGLDWSVNVPGGVVWWIESIVAILTSSATAGNRTARLFIGDGTTTPIVIPSMFTQAASLGPRYSWIRQAGWVVATGGTSGCGIGLPPIPVPGGWSISTNTASLQANDQWSGIAFYVLEVVELTDQWYREYREYQAVMGLSAAVPSLDTGT